MTDRRESMRDSKFGMRLSATFGKLLRAPSFLEMVSLSQYNLHIVHTARDRLNISRMIMSSILHRFNFKSWNCHIPRAEPQASLLTFHSWFPLISKWKRIAHFVKVLFFFNDWFIEV
jgi:hypothetical protein